MKRFFGCSMVVLAFAGCGSSPDAKVVKAPSASPTETAATRPRLWVSETDESHSVTGYIELGGTGTSILYELGIEGETTGIVLRHPKADDLFAQSGTLSGERKRRGYLSINDPGGSLRPFFRHPRGTQLIVFFEDGDDLVAKLMREAAPEEEAPRRKRFPIVDGSGHVSLQCPRSDVGGGGNGWGPVKRGHRTPERALRDHFSKHRYTWPSMPDPEHLRRAKSGSRWAPFVYRKSGRNLAVVRVFRSGNGWGVKYTYACDSAMR